MQRRLEYFVSKAGLDIKQVGPALIADLITAKLAAGPESLYLLTDEQWRTIRGDKVTSNIQASLLESKKQPAWRVLCALGIPQVAQGGAQRLLEAFGSIQRALMATKEQLEEVPDVGPITAEQVVKWTEDPENWETLQALSECGLTMTVPKPDDASVLSRSTKLAGTWVITGTLSQTRDHFEALIVANGGKTLGSVSAKTDFLLVGDKAGSKLTKAQKLGVSVLDETALTGC